MIGETGKKLIVFLCMAVCLLVLDIGSSRAQSWEDSCSDCDSVGCAQPNCIDTEKVIREQLHNDDNNNNERAVMKKFSEEALFHRDWLYRVFFIREILPAMQRMTHQLSAGAIHQIFMIGPMFDVKQLQETTREMELLRTEAYKDYATSDGVCRFGTAVRSLAATEDRAEKNLKNFHAHKRLRHFGRGSEPPTGGRDFEDVEARWETFIKEYCDPKDNHWTRGGTGLERDGLCKNRERERMNIDIDYTRLVDVPRTLDIDFTTSGTPDNDTEKHLTEMSQYLYGHDVVTRNIDKRRMNIEGAGEKYMELRSVNAKRDIAEYAFDSIIALKAQGDEGMYDERGTGGKPDTTRYLIEILKELGTSEEDAFEMIGERPSLYAQLEILTKKVFQDPNFYVNLYDTPANVKRKMVTLAAIERMLDDALIKSKYRQEMLISVLLSSEIDNKYDFQERGN